MKNLKELPDRLEALQRKGEKKIRKCSFGNCVADTAKNHCVSQSFLKNICSDGYIRELTVSPWVDGMLLYKKKGIGEATTFHGLCSVHDHKLFEPIDRLEIETTYDNLILLAYRSLLREKLKKTIKMEAYGAFSTEFRHVRNEMVRQTALKSSQFRFNLLSVKWFEDLLIKEIVLPAGNFVFRQIDFPYFEVAGSELFTYEPDHVTHFKRQVYEGGKVLMPFSDIFVNLIPSKKENKLIMTVGAHVKDTALVDDLLRQLSSDEPLKSLSDILFLQVGDWVCSEAFYRQYLDGKIPKIVDLFKETAGVGVIHRATTFNVFCSD
jgi:hypothetical protein